MAHPFGLPALHALSSLLQNSNHRSPACIIFQSQIISLCVELRTSRKIIAKQHIYNIFFCFSLSSFYIQKWRHVCIYNELHALCVWLKIPFTRIGSRVVALFFVYFFFLIMTNAGPLALFLYAIRYNSPWFMYGESLN